MKYPMPSFLINDNGPGFVAIYCSDSVKVERLGEHTYEVVIKKNERGNPEVYPLDLGIKRGDFITVRVDSHDNGLVRYRLVPILDNPKGKDLLSRIREHLPRK